MSAYVNCVTFHEPVSTMNYRIHSCAHEGRIHDHVKGCTCMMNCPPAVAPDTIISRMQRSLNILRDNRKVMTTIYSRVLPPVPSCCSECGPPGVDNLTTLCELLEAEVVALNSDLLNLVAVL
jgi:hypothetical protein